MSTFEDVVKQLQMNNRSEAGRDGRQTKMLGELKTAIEGLTVATESADEPDSAEEENEKDNRSRARKLLDAVVGVKDSIGTAFKNVGAIKTGIPGITLGTLAKLAVIPLIIKFLRSPVWDDIKAFLIDPSFEQLGNLFKQYTVEMTTLTAIVGGFAIVKLIGIAGSLATAFSTLSGFFVKVGGIVMKVLIPLGSGIATAFTSISAGLTSFGAILGVGTAAAAGVIVAIVAGIVLIGKGLYDAFIVFRDKFKETGSILESLKEAAIEFVGTIAGLPFDLLKNLTSFLARKLGFENFANTLDQFSFEDVVKNAVRDLFAGFTQLFDGVKKFFTGGTFEERLQGLFGAATGIGDILFFPIDQAIKLIRGLFSLAGFEMPEFKVTDLIIGLVDQITGLFEKVLNIDFGQIFENAKKKVLDAVENIKESIPVPDFSVVGDKIAALAMFFSPTRLLNMIGDAIEAADFVTGTGFLKKPLLKIFGTTAKTAANQAEETLQSDADVNMMQSGGFLQAGKFALVGEQGPELIMSKAPTQVFSEQRTDQLGMAALNKVTGGGGGGGSTALINNGGNVSNVNQKTINQTSITHKDPIMDMVGASVAY